MLHSFLYLVSPGIKEARIFFDYCELLVMKEKRILYKQDGHQCYNAHPQKKPSSLRKR